MFTAQSVIRFAIAGAGAEISHATPIKASSNAIIGRSSSKRIRFISISFPPNWRVKRDSRLRRLPLTLVVVCHLPKLPTKSISGMIACGLKMTR